MCAVYITAQSYEKKLIAVCDIYVYAVYSAPASASMRAAVVCDILCVRIQPALSRKNLA